MTISLTDLTLYLGALVILFLTPGPVWLALTARAMSGGFKAAWPLAIGVAIGDLLWPLVAILGIAWILSVFDLFMAVMRWVACGVFVAMGVMLLRHASHAISADSRLTRPGMLPGFMAGVMSILGNPKAVLFYMGVLPGFFDLRSITVPDIAAILAVSVAVPLMGNLIMAASIGKLRGLLTKPSTLQKINRASGILLILVGGLIVVV